MDVDYLIDDVFKQEEPLGLESLKNSSIDYYISLVDAEDGSLRFFGREDKVDPFELLRATKALPFLYGKTVRILGREYFDGSIGQPLQGQIDFAISMGATKILFINDSAPRTFINIFLVWLCTLRTSRSVRRMILKDLRTKRGYTTPSNIELLYVNRESLPTSLSSNNKSRLTETLECGVSDALRMQKELSLMFKG